MQQELLQEIVKRVGRKYSLMNELYTNTVELGRTLSDNDRVSAQLIIQMRQDAIDSLQKCDKELHLLMEALTPGDRQLVEMWMAGDETEAPLEHAKLVHLIAEMGRNLKAQIKKTVDLDRQVNMRLAGEHSYYNQKK